MKRKTEKRFPVRILISLVILLLLIFAAMEFYHHVEGWDRLDSAYYSVITFTTVGYGDFTPQTGLGKIATIFFSIIGIAVAFHFLFLFGSYIFEKKVSAEQRRIKQKVKESEEDKKSNKRKSGKKSKKRNLKKK